MQLDIKPATRSGAISSTPTTTPSEPVTPGRSAVCSAALPSRGAGLAPTGGCRAGDTAAGATRRCSHALVQLGLQHEQQHQELLLMDLLDGFHRQPLEPVYNPEAELTLALEPDQWLPAPAG